MSDNWYVGYRYRFPHHCFLTHCHAGLGASMVLLHRTVIKSWFPLFFFFFFLIFFLFLFEYSGFHHWLHLSPLPWASSWQKPCHTCQPYYLACMLAGLIWDISRRGLKQVSRETLVMSFPSPASSPSFWGMLQPLNTSLYFYMGLLQKHHNLEWVFDRMVLASYAVQECKKLQQTTRGGVSVQMYLFYWVRIQNLGPYHTIKTYDNC